MVEAQRSREARRFRRREAAEERTARRWVRALRPRTRLQQMLETKRSCRGTHSTESRPLLLPSTSNRRSTSITPCSRSIAARPCQAFPFPEQTVRLQRASLRACVFQARRSAKEGPYEAFSRHRVGVVLHAFPKVGVVGAAVETVAALVESSQRNAPTRLDADKFVGSSPSSPFYSPPWAPRGDRHGPYIHLRAPWSCAPPSFPTASPPIFESKQFFSNKNMDTDTLFFIFYYQQVSQSCGGVPNVAKYESLKRRLRASLELRLAPL